MITTLILGGVSESRQEKINELLKPLNIHPADKITLESDTSIGIEMVRNIQKQLSFTPVSGLNKALIIPHAETLTTESQQALLKTFEEPPPHTHIILCAPAEDILLPTILSRCHIIRLPSPIASLTEDEVGELTIFWQDILAKPPISRLAVIAEPGKGKEPYILYLQQQLLFWHQQLIMCSKKEEKFSLITSFNIVKKAVETLKLIHMNVNPRLALDHFFLSL